MDRLEKDVLQTLSYFAFFQYPVTAFELWKWMMDPGREYTLQEIIAKLEHSKISRLVQESNGFYALGNAFDWVEERRVRFLDALEKRKKAQRYIRFLKRIPSIRFIGLCNSLPFYFTQAESDIDIFIIVDDGSLWSTRLSSVAPLIALRQRPGEALHSPIDCSFFLNANHLSLEEVKIDEKDPYLAVWIQSMVPVYERHDGEFKRFLEQNHWAGTCLPNSASAVNAQVHKKPLLQLPIGFSEKFAHWLQNKKMPLRIKMLSQEGTEVVINEKMLKFHLNDRRQEIKDFMQTV